MGTFVIHVGVVAFCRKTDSHCPLVRLVDHKKKKKEKPTRYNIILVYDIIRDKKKKKIATSAVRRFDRPAPRTTAVGWGGRREAVVGGVALSLYRLASGNHLKPTTVPRETGVILRR